MARSHGKDLQVIPVHVSPAVIIHMVMPDMVLLPEPVIFVLIQEIQLAVEIRHLGVKDEVNSRISLPQLFPVRHGILMADDILHQQIHSVLLRCPPERSEGPQVVFKPAVGYHAVPQVKDHPIRSQGSCNTAVDPEKAERFPLLLLSSPCDVLSQGFFTVQDRNPEAEGLQE